jgi:hypothetical protein
MDSSDNVTRNPEGTADLANKFSRFLRDLFVRATLRNVHYKDNHARIRALYSTTDPWNLASEKEGFRFHATNEAILEYIGRVDSVLEIGSGEGHQSLALMKVTKSLTGIDISAQAVNRAKERCPSAIFFASDTLDCARLPSNQRYTLATACEVLYYVKDVPTLLIELESLADWCLVTYYIRHAAKLDPLFLGIPDVKSRTFCYEDTTWKLHCWRSPRTGEFDPSHDPL